MILHRVIIFLFYWQYICGENLETISVESVLDHVAIPTGIINKFLQKSTKNLHSRKYVANEHVESSTIRYENANGFVPLVTSSQPYLKQYKNNLTEYSRNENTLNETKNSFVPPKDARLFFNFPTVNDNRRTFDLDDNLNGFDFLKVNNGTPAVANYNSYYNRSKDEYKPSRSNADVNYGNPLRFKHRERGARVQKYTDGYDTSNGDKRPFAESEGLNTNNNKNVYQTERNYQYNEVTTAGYRTQKILPRNTNYPTVATTRPSIRAFTPRLNQNEEYKFKKPIMVKSIEYQPAEAFGGQSSPSSTTPAPYHRDSSDDTKNANLENKRSESLQTEETNRNYDPSRYKDFSNENVDYMDEVEAPRRVQKTNKRYPYRSNSSRKLPKEHRETYDDVYDDNGRKRPNKPKPRQKPKPKPVQILNEDDVYDNEEQYDNNASTQQYTNNGNTWNQVGPNVEISHSNGYEINQIEKPKLHIVPVNIISNFDHATALDNSQGFDITNAMFAGVVHGTPLVSTAAPLMSSSQNYFDQNPISFSTAKPYTRTSTSVPDVIVGQSSFNTPFQAVLMPNKIQQNLLSQYMHSTVSPALLTATPRPQFLSSSTISPNWQQMLSQVQTSIPANQNLFDAQPTQETYVNSNRNQGKHLYQYQNSLSTTNQPYSERLESQNKKFNSNNGQFIASASLSVEHDSNHQTSNKYGNKRSNYRNNKHSKNNSNEENTQRNKRVKGVSSNNYARPTVIPAILHTGIGIISNNNGYQLASIPSNDNVGGSSNINSVNNLIDPIQKAQLPLLGTTNVEIINPNLNANAYSINQVPATLVTTPIPIFTTTGFLTSKQAFSSTTQDPVNGDRALFNPINFVPNYDLIKSQSVLNSNIVPNNQFVQHNLNLVPVVAGGNFYKQGAQVDLTSKPKLSSELEKYAEEMFKESLRTIYNSHKWNNDPRSIGNISLVDNSEFAKLRNELLRLKNHVRNSKPPPDELEAYHTENKIRTTKPDSSVEHYKNRKPHTKGNRHHLHHHHHSHRQKHKSAINDFLTPPKLNSFISKSPFHDKPSKKRPSRGHGQGHGPRSNFNQEKSRLRPRQSLISQNSKGLESQSSTFMDYRYPIRQQYSPRDYYSDQIHNYPSFTTSLSENDQYRSSGEYKSSERDTHDANHQRTHNLMGLLMKNKQLPSGIQENYYIDRQSISNIFDDDYKRMQSRAYEDTFKSLRNNQMNKVER